jgi:four helix bundle protein
MENSYTFYFEKLNVFKNLRLLANEIYTCSGFFPEEEKFILVSQIRRAAISS